MLFAGEKRTTELFLRNTGFICGIILFVCGMLSLFARNRRLFALYTSLFAERPNSIKKREIAVISLFFLFLV